ncbi:hypothetical protein [Dysosmobacter welbionis]
METGKKIITLKRVVALLITVCVILFAAQNMNPVGISFIFFSVKIPLLFLILGLFVLGVLVGIILQKRKSSQSE